ncbi:hypothetical protein HHI36_021936 [Cryptolaemus montrouzieri]|uniref:J domain-containing protein n=1 Tax=Cryptolaemus montrouzieri TaxID=559131 RepID=A0ABD2MYJ5_9CUCU
MSNSLKSLCSLSFNSCLLHLKCIKLSRNSLAFTSELGRRFQHSKDIKCWKCGIERKNINELFCPKCNIIQNPEDKNNYFNLLQCDVSFDIDSKTLRDKYRHMQSVLHPDKFSNRSLEEKNISGDFSSLVNKAYDILQSPLKRAVHLLALKGEKIKEDERIEDPEFLMEIMELNEEVENASTPEKLKILNVSNRETMRQIEQDISNFFKQNNLEKVKSSIIKLRYYTSVSQHINELLRERGIVD